MKIYSLNKRIYKCLQISNKIIILLFSKVLKDAVILTGCSGHLGSAMLSGLMEEYIVIGISRNSQNINLSKDIEHRFIPLNADMSLEKVELLLDKIKIIIKENKISLKGLINNAIFNYPNTPLSIDQENTNSVVEGIFSYHVRLTIGLLPFLTSPSSIINISSIYGKVSPDPAIYNKDIQMNPLLYGCMKAALIQSSKYLSSILSESNIRVNSVSFGPFPSEKTINENPLFIKELSKKTHLKRIGKAKEAVGIIKFLLSEESSFITGADIPVDGGWTAW